jgi:sugar lactone lactonase YvrE
MLHTARLATLTFTLLVGVPALAEMTLPPGFSAETYATGRGFDTSRERDSRGMPSLATLAFDHFGTLYLARIGARFRTGEADELSPIYRIPAGGARMTAETEARHLYGPPLLNPRVGWGREGDVYVTTYDRDRKLGAVYRIRDGRASLFAGGTPPTGTLPLFRTPEGVALDSSGNVYVVDREQGSVVKLDPSGKLLNPRFVTGVGRGGPLVIDAKDHLWIGSDGTAPTPFQDGSGQIWRATPDGALTLVLQGPIPSGLSASPGGAVFAVQRRANRIFVVTPEGQRIDFGIATDDTILRNLSFAPVTGETKKAGIGGNLFLVTSPRSNFAFSEVIRVAGPFDDFVRDQVSR